MLRAILALLMLGTLCGGEAMPDPTAALASLRPGHPRLLLDDRRLAEIRQLATSDPLLRRCIAEVLAGADKACDAKPLQRVLVGPRLLKVSRDCLGRVLSLGLAWRLSGDGRYLAAGRRCLAEVCAFTDWNPSHFLDVAEMTNAVGIGLDWFWSGLTAEERESIRAGLVRHGLDAGVAASGGWDGSGKPAWWCVTDNNWNLVCHGGLLVGALAVADSDPRYATYLLPRAVREMPRALDQYAPDGAWPEGPGYWAYATGYTVFGLAALDTALGTTCGLDARPGLDRAGAYLLASRGPTGLLPNFADVGDRSRFAGNPVLYWLAERFHQPALAAAEACELADRPARPLDVVWYRPATGPAPTLPRDARFTGPVPLAMFRSAWDDPEALSAYIKAGYNTVNHGHLDLGSFEFDLLGQRWARDLGSDDYDLPGYFSGGEHGKRWSYYRLVSHSHSVPLLDRRDQAVAGTATITAFAGGDVPHAIVDFSSAYPAASRARRGLALVDGRQALLIQDEFELPEAHQLTWAMTTDAGITLDGRRAVLALGGKTIEARLLGADGAVFAIESAERPAPEKANAGVQRLLVVLPPQTGSVRLAVLLGPAEVAEPPLQPLDRW